MKWIEREKTRAVDIYVPCNEKCHRFAFNGEALERLYTRQTKMETYKTYRCPYCGEIEDIATPYCCGCGADCRGSDV